MNLDIPVFERSTLKRVFYFFMAFNVLICIASILLVALFSYYIPGKTAVTNNMWIIMAALMLLTFAFTAKSKKELKAVLQATDFKAQVLKYHSYYKRKLLWNGFSIVMSGLLLVMTEKNLFFYILIIQLLLSVAFYPARKSILKELNNPEIIFT